MTSGNPEGRNSRSKRIKISIKSAFLKSCSQSEANEKKLYSSTLVMVCFGIMCPSLALSTVLFFLSIVAYFASKGWGGFEIGWAKLIGVFKSILLKTYPFTRKGQVMFWVPHNFFRASKQLARAGALKITPKSWFS